MSQRGDYPSETKPYLPPGKLASYYLLNGHLETLADWNPCMN